jgi:hypothetical protein
VCGLFHSSSASFLFTGVGSCGVAGSWGFGGREVVGMVGLVLALDGVGARVGVWGVRFVRGLFGSLVVLITC